MIECILYKSSGKVKNIKVLASNLNLLPDGKYRVRVDSAKVRSSSQNAYYWSCVIDLVYEGLRTCGFDSVRNKNDAHEICKALFLKVIDEKNGIKIERVLSTRELTTIGFQEYLLNISVWAFDYLSISIPEPGQQLTIETVNI